ncbi:MAG TPA: TetR/AcrR family transcriptional regulator [Rhizomicrobium sp.]|jgi:AcrR family transcriptional regulator|nr:TetR/AcrR family transcriptional regulator [Rhizomicrobium sp.]
MKTESTRQSIATVARDILDQEGSDAVTMRRVAEIVKITPMAIYRHYKAREGLLAALADDGFEDLAARIARKRFPGTAAERLTKMAEIFLDHALQHPRLFELMFLREREGARRYPRDFKAGRSPTASLMAQAVREGMASGEFLEEDAWEITFEMGALSHGLIMLYLGGRMSVSTTEFRALYRRSFQRYLRGIRK